MVMVTWGDKWLAGKAGPPVLYRHHACGELSRVDLRCAYCESRCTLATSTCFPGPAPRREQPRWGGAAHAVVEVPASE